MVAEAAMDLAALEGHWVILQVIILIFSMIIIINVIISIMIIIIIINLYFVMINITLYLHNDYYNLY